MLLTAQVSNILTAMNVELASAKTVIDQVAVGQAYSWNWTKGFHPGRSYSLSAARTRSFALDSRTMSCVLSFPVSFQFPVLALTSRDS